MTDGEHAWKQAVKPPDPDSIANRGLPVAERVELRPGDDTVLASGDGGELPVVPSTSLTILVSFVDAARHVTEAMDVRRTSGRGT